MENKGEKNLAQLGFLKKDKLGERGRFGIVFRGKLDRTLDVAVKRVEKKKTRVPETQFYYNTNGYPNVINFFCLIADNPKFTSVSLHFLYLQHYFIPGSNFPVYSSFM